MRELHLNSVKEDNVIDDYRTVFEEDPKLNYIIKFLKSYEFDIGEDSQKRQLKIPIHKSPNPLIQEKLRMVMPQNLIKLKFKPERPPKESSRKRKSNPSSHRKQDRDDKHFEEPQHSQNADYEHLSGVELVDDTNQYAQNMRRLEKANLEKMNSHRSRGSNLSQKSRSVKVPRRYERMQT